MCYPGVYNRKACSDRIQERARQLTATTDPDPNDDDSGQDETPDSSTDQA